MATTSLAHVCLRLVVDRLYMYPGVSQSLGSPSRYPPGRYALPVSIGMALPMNHTWQVNAHCTQHLRVHTLQNAVGNDLHNLQQAKHGSAKGSSSICGG
jgi:hypothetical protein